MSQTMITYIHQNWMFMNSSFNPLISNELEMTQEFRATFHQIMVTFKNSEKTIEDAEELAKSVFEKLQIHGHCCIKYITDEEHELRYIINEDGEIDEDSIFNEEIIDAQEMEYEGATYIVNPENGEIYDIDGEEIGVWDFDTGIPVLDSLQQGQGH
jgi:hypothetical protein|tara:strand:- start:95 stop:562 length:468 start_codon:yes stop_codon:yes gene_type:complete